MRPVGATTYRQGIDVARERTTSVLRVNVLLVCRTGDSGLTDYTFCLAHELEKVVDVKFVTSSAALAHPARGGTVIVPIFRRMRTAPLDVIRLVRYVLKCRPDCVLFQSWMWSPMTDALVVRCLRMLRIQVSATVHDVQPHYPLPWSAASCGLFFRSFDRLIAHSQIAKQRLRQQGVTAPILVVPHGEYRMFNVDHITRRSARQWLGWGDEEMFVVLFFGHLDERKGVLELLEVATRFRGDDKVRFLIAGRDDLAPKSRDEFARGLSTNVVVHSGRVPFNQVQHYFAAADVVVLPYKEGSTSGVVKVAIAFERPVIASRVGDLEESLEGWPSILIDPTNIVDQLETALKYAKRQGIKGKEDIAAVRARFDWASIGRQYAEHLGLCTVVRDFGIPGESTFDRQ